MKLETIKKDKKKHIIIGSMIVLSVVGCLTLTTSRAKYRNIQNIKLANGVVDYKVPDLKLAIKVSEDGANYKNQTTIPEGNYNFNTEKSKCRIPTSTLVGEEAPVAKGVTIEYIDGKINVLGVTKKDTRCYIYFDKVLGQTSSSIIGKIKASGSSYKGTTIPNFSSGSVGAETEENSGIFITDDSMYGTNAITYYWRGAATTNHVIFANMCWRIVRINGDGSIRLIYNGSVQSENTCTGNGSWNGSVIMGSSNDEKYYATSDGQYNNSSYAGWTYTLSQQWPTTNVQNSNAKIQTEKWYDENIIKKDYDEKVTVGKFCSDRTVQKNGYTWLPTGEKFNYDSYTRLYANFTPTFECKDSRDIYDLKIGAITADEVMFAGGISNKNYKYYLYNGQNYWTMSPNYWNGGSAMVFSVRNDGYLDGPSVGNNTVGLRPVINLRSDVTFNVGSDGTQNNPYIVQ